MIYQKLRKVGNSYVVTIPPEELERLNASEGDLLAITLNRAEIKPVLDDDLKALAEESWEEHKAAYEYLDGR